MKEAVTAYETTCTNLKELCDKYQHATELWKQYKEASDLVKDWLDNPMEEVENLEPEEAVEKVKVCDNKAVFIFYFMNIYRTKFTDLI